MIVLKQHYLCTLQMPQEGQQAGPPRRKRISPAVIELYDSNVFALVKTGALSTFLDTAKSFLYFNYFLVYLGNLQTCTEILLFSCQTYVFPCHSVFPCFESQHFS